MPRSTPRTGEVVGHTATRHTSAEFVGFLQTVVETQPRRREMHIIGSRKISSLERRMLGYFACFCLCSRYSRFCSYCGCCAEFRLYADRLFKAERRDHYDLSSQHFAHRDKDQVTKRPIQGFATWDRASGGRQIPIRC